MGGRAIIIGVTEARRWRREEGEEDGENEDRWTGTFLNQRPHRSSMAIAVRMMMRRRMMMIMLLNVMLMMMLLMMRMVIMMMTVMTTKMVLPKRA